MLNKHEIINFIKTNDIKNHFHIRKIGLFGSFAKDRQTENSDIDIILELEDNTENIFEIKQELRKMFAKKFNREIDIAREKYLKKYIKDEILKETIYV